MASSQAESSFFYESDDFTFEERSSMYELQLERLRKDGKVCVRASGRHHFGGIQ